MGDIFVNVDDSLDKAFRDKAAKRFGPKQGALKKALEDAMRLWLAEDPNKTVPSL